MVVVGGFGVAFLAASLLSACDTQASNEYRGESLLTLQGSVEIMQATVEGPLVPAIAFITEGESISILDVAVDGMFPSSFTLNVFDPPPAHVIGDFAVFGNGYQLPGEPRGTWGFITAVPPDHRDTFPLATGPSIIGRSGGEGGSGGAAGGGGSGGSGGSGQDTCFLEAEWCTPSGECRREHYECPNDQARGCSVHAENEFVACALTHSEGDPELGVDVFERFAGMSENYAVLYLEDEAPAGSWVAHFFSDDGAIPAGYSLIEITVLDGSAQAQGRDLLRGQCERLAEDTAIQRIFEQHSGSVPREQIAECAWLRHEENPPSFCADFEIQEARALAERDCPFDDFVMRRVHDPANTPINVRIGPNLGFENGGN